MIKNTTDNHLV